MLNFQQLRDGICAYPATNDSIGSGSFMLLGLGLFLGHSIYTFHL